MIGGEWFETLYGNPDDVSKESLTKVAVEELRKHLGITESPINVFTRIHKVK